MIHAFYKETGRLFRSARNDALILVFASLFAPTGVNNLFAFTVTYPDSPVVITELDPTLTNFDFCVARVLVRDSHDYLYVVYPMTYGIYISRSTDNGFTWSVFARPATRREDTDQFHAPCIAIDSGDSIYVTWEGYKYLLWNNLYYNKYNGKVWSGEKKVDRDSGRYNRYISALAVDRNNTLHVVWTGPEEGVCVDTLWHTYMNPQGEWAWPPVEVGDQPQSYHPSLMSDSASNLHLGYVWDMLGCSLWQFPHYRKRLRDGPWLPVEDLRIIRGSVDTASGITLTVIPGDTIPRALLPTTTFKPFQQSFIYYRFKQDTGWSVPEVLVPYQQYAQPYLSGITADRQGHSYVAWEWQQTYRGGNVVANNIWMREQEYPPLWSQPFKVTNDTIPIGARSGAWNGYPILGYPVTENGVEITWVKTAWDTLTGQHYYLMYKRLPSLLGVEQEKEKSPPSEPELTLSPRPNPARGTMEITYGIPASNQQGMVNLTIYNLLGERVRTLVHGPTPGGVYRARWNGKDERLKEVPSGTYFFQLTVREKQVIKKGTLIR